MAQCTKLGFRLTSTIFILAIAGQIAWAVENNWFNVFVFDMVSPNPDVVAWMVAVSAATATITSLIMGTLSDHTIIRMGKRKTLYSLWVYLMGNCHCTFPNCCVYPNHWNSCSYGSHNRCDYDFFWVDCE